MTSTEAPPVTASWSWVVGPWNGGPQYELTRARSRRATFNLTEPSTASFTISGRDPLAAHIDELVTDLHLLRRPARGRPAERLYRGRVGPTRDDIDADKHTVSVPTLDYRAVLARRRLLAQTGALTWAQIDQGQIVADLLGDSQSRPGGDLGMEVAGAATGVLRDRTLEPGDSIGEKIQELSETMDGFEWDVLSPTARSLVLQLWPRRGTDRGVVLQLGGLAASVRRSVDPAQYANSLLVTGNAPEGGGDPPAPVRIEADDIAARPEGRWEQVIGESITGGPALQDRAEWLLDDRQVIRPSYTVKLRRGAWRGPSHIWLGDPARLAVMSRPRLRVDTTLRVLTLDVDLSDDGAEDVTLTLGASAPSFAARAAATDRRLAELERR